MKKKLPLHVNVLPRATEGTREIFFKGKKKKIIFNELGLFMQTFIDRPSNPLLFVPVHP